MNASTVVHHPALTDPRQVAELGPTECARRCGQLVQPDRAWIVHNGRVEHVDCHEAEPAGPSP